MMLSQKSKYALRALLVLSQEYGKGPVQVSEIATREKIPHRFLKLILLKLKNHGVLLSRKGKGGGYFLRKSPDHISFGQVLRILEGLPSAAALCQQELHIESAGNALMGGRAGSGSS